MEKKFKSFLRRYKTIISILCGIISFSIILFTGCMIQTASSGTLLIDLILRFLFGCIIWLVFTLSFLMIYAVADGIKKAITEYVIK